MVSSKQSAAGLAMELNKLKALYRVAGLAMELNKLKALYRVISD